MSSRLLTDIEIGGTRRGSVETQNLLIHARHNDSLFVECIRTFKECFVDANVWFRRLEGAEQVQAVMNTEVFVVVLIVMVVVVLIRLVVVR